MSFRFRLSLIVSAAALVAVFLAHAYDDEHPAHSSPPSINNPYPDLPSSSLLNSELIVKNAHIIPIGGDFCKKVQQTKVTKIFLQEVESLTGQFRQATCELVEVAHIFNGMCDDMDLGWKTLHLYPSFSSLKATQSVSNDLRLCGLPSNFRAYFDQFIFILPKPVPTIAFKLINMMLNTFLNFDDYLTEMKVFKCYSNNNKGESALPKTTENILYPLGNTGIPTILQSLMPELQSAAQKIVDSVHPKVAGFVRLNICRIFWIVCLKHNGHEPWDRHIQSKGLNPHRNFSPHRAFSKAVPATCCSNWIVPLAIRRIFRTVRSHLKGSKGFETWKGRYQQLNPALKAARSTHSPNWVAPLTVRRNFYNVCSLLKGSKSSNTGICSYSTSKLPRAIALPDADEDAISNSVNARIIKLMSPLVKMAKICDDETLVEFDKEILVKSKDTNNRSDHSFWSKNILSPISVPDGEHFPDSSMPKLLNQMSKQLQAEAGTLSDSFRDNHKFFVDKTICTILPENGQLSGHINSDDCQHVKDIVSQRRL